MEKSKSPTYTVMTPAHLPTKRQWAAWAALGVGIVALVVAGITATMAIRQLDHKTQMEVKMMTMERRMVAMESHLEEVLEFTLASHDYFDDYEDGNDDDNVDLGAQPGPYEHLTLQRVVRRRRQANTMNEDDQGVPIFDQAYGVNLKSQRASEGLRLYESLQVGQGEGDPSSPQVTIEVTESPIKPYHRISSLWVPKTRQRYPASSLTTKNFGSDDDNGIINRRRAITERRSRTKSLHGSGRRARPRQKHRAPSNTNPVSVQFRDTRVKATSRHDGFDTDSTNSNSVVPPVLPPPGSSPRVVVQQGPLPYIQRRTGYNFPPANLLTKDANQKKRRSRNKQGRRRRRGRSAFSLAHFIADNSTSQGYTATSPPHSWVAAAWMTNLGLNRKYSLDQDTVVVKEAGLYYLYAQVLYEAGRIGSGFQILVDDIPILECSLAPSHPSPSCHTSGASYIPRHAAVSVRDLDSHTRVVRRHPNTFFGLVKLMDAPDSAEQLLIS